MQRLTGTNLAPLTTKKARELIGKKITYLRTFDIDQSGRGYFFARSGIVADVYKGNLAVDDKNNFIGTLKSFVEVVVDEG